MSCTIEMEEGEVNLDYPEVPLTESIQDEELSSTDEEAFKEEEEDRKFLELRHYHTQQANEFYGTNIGPWIKANT